MYINYQVVAACMLGYFICSFYVMLVTVGAVPDHAPNATTPAAALLTAAMPRGSLGEEYGPRARSHDTAHATNTTTLEYCIVFGNPLFSGIAAFAGVVLLCMKTTAAVARMANVLCVSVCILLAIQTTAIITSALCSKGSGGGDTQCTCTALFCNYWGSMEGHFLFPACMASAAATATILFC